MVSDDIDHRVVLKKRLQCDDHLVEALGGIESLGNDLFARAD